MGGERFSSGGHQPMESHPSAPASRILTRPSLGANLPGDDGRPQETAPFQPLREQACALAVMPDNLQQIAATAPKAEQMPAQGIMPKHLLNLQRQARKLLAQIRVPGRQPHPHARRDRNYRRSRRARTRDKAATSTPVPTMTRRPRASTISMRSSPGLAQRDALFGVAAVGRLGYNHGRHEARHRARQSFSLQGATTPSQKLRPRDAVAPRRRGDKARAGQALQHDPGLLVLRPAAAPPGLDDLKTPERAARMTVHTHCSQRQIGCAARRPSPEAHEQYNPS